MQNLMKKSILRCGSVKCLTSRKVERRSPCRARGYPFQRRGFGGLRRGSVEAKTLRQRLSEAYIGDLAWPTSRARPDGNRPNRVSPFLRNDEFIATQSPLDRGSCALRPRAYPTNILLFPGGHGILSVCSDSSYAYWWTDSCRILHSAWPLHRSHTPLHRSAPGSCPFIHVQRLYVSS